MKKEFYKSPFTKIIFAFLSFVLLVVITSCENEVTPSLYSDKPEGSTPVISSVDPPSDGLAGVTLITITGQNFSEDPSKNFVYFDGTRAAALETSTTRIVVRAPEVIKQGIKIKIAVHGAELFSNDWTFNLAAAISLVYPFKDFEDPYAITVDNQGNIFMSLVSDNVGQGILKLTPDGTLSNFAPKGGETFYNGIKVYESGSGTILYGVRNVRAVFEIKEGTAPRAIAMPESAARLLDLDFDAEKNIWTGGQGGKIYRISLPDESNKSFDFAINFTSLRIYNDYIYVNGETATESGVWRIQIISKDELGAPEKVFSFSDHFNIASDKITAITFSADGEMFLGTNTSAGIIRVLPDGSFAAWYPGLITPPIVSLAWDTGVNLYYSQGKLASGQTQEIYKINMERLGAPYNGRN